MPAHIHRECIAYSTHLQISLRSRTSHTWREEKVYRLLRWKEVRFVRVFWSGQGEGGNRPRLWRPSPSILPTILKCAIECVGDRGDPVIFQLAFRLALLTLAHESFPRCANAAIQPDAGTAALRPRFPQLLTCTPAQIVPPCFNPVRQTTKNIIGAPDCLSTNVCAALCVARTTILTPLDYDYPCRHRNGDAAREPSEGQGRWR